MAGYRETFESNLDYAYGQGRGGRDIASRLESQVSAFGGALGQLSAASRKASQDMRNLRHRINDLQNERWDALQEFGEASKEVEKLNRKLAETKRQLIDLKKARIDSAFKGLELGVGRVAKGLIGLNTTILGLSFGFLIDSIKRVYELQERWTKAIGGFNMKLGGMTAGLRGAQKAAVQWSSTIRGLTGGDINEGIEMFGEFTMAIGRTVKAGDGFSKLGLQMARGFNLQGAGAGQMLKVFENLGMTVGESAETMKVAIKAANAAGVPTNMLADDLKESITYMARFGKEGQKTLVQGAAWARKYDISLQQLKAAVEDLDMFDEAARYASRLNMAFGTFINSMDLMMEDDPAKRLEMVRQQFIAQGRTFDTLSVKETRYLKENMKLSEEQIAALFNRGESYEDFQKRADKAAKNEASAQKMMQKQLQATVQTMYSFGQAFDRITVAIANAIKPLLEVFGLARTGGKEFKSFGQVMESVTTTVEHFFQGKDGKGGLAGNDKWQKFMRTLATDLKRAAGALKDFVFSGGAAKLVGRMAEHMQRFYTFVRDLGLKAAQFLDPVVNAFFWLSKHLGTIAAIWGGLKLTNMLGAGNIAQSLGLLGGGQPNGLKAGAMRGGVGGAAGLGIGAALGGGGAMVGGAIGGIAGSFLGPLGQALGPIAGALLGKGLDMLAGLFEQKSPLQKAREELQKALEKEKATRDGLSAILEAAESRREAEDRGRAARNKILAAMEKTALQQKDKAIVLTDLEAQMLQRRAHELGMFGKSSKEAKELLEKLGTGSKVTAAQLNKLVQGAQAYETELQKLRGHAQQEADVKRAELEEHRLGREKASLESLNKLREAELKVGREQLKGMQTSDLNKLRNLAKIQTGDSSAEKMMETANKLGIKLNTKELEALRFEMMLNKKQLDLTNDQKKLAAMQTDFMKEMTRIELRKLASGSAEFLNFSNTAEMRGKSFDERFKAFLDTADGRGLVGGQVGVDLLRSGSGLAGIAAPTGRTGAAPMPAKPFLESMGGAYGMPAASSPIIVQSTVMIDGEVAGKAIGKSRGLKKSLAGSSLRE